MLNNWNTWVPKPLDVLVEYLRGHKGSVVEGMLIDIVDSNTLPCDGEVIIEVCGRHLKHLPNRTRKESLRIAKMQVDMTIEGWIRPGVVAYTYAAHAEHRKLRDELHKRVEVGEEMCDWLNSGVVTPKHMPVLKKRLSRLHDGLYGKKDSMIDSAVAAVAVYDVMTAMEVVPKGEGLFESFTRRLAYLSSVYAVRNYRSPKTNGNEVLTYVSRQVNFKQVAVKK